MLCPVMLVVQWCKGGCKGGGIKGWGVEGGGRVCVWKGYVCQKEYVW